MDTNLIRVKTKYQVTLPYAIQKATKLRVGDLLGVEIKGSTIILTPKDIIEREMAFALDDIKHGRGIGPFTTAKAAIKALHREARKYKAKK